MSESPANNQTYRQESTFKQNQVQEAQNVANGNSQNSAPIVPTMFVPSMTTDSNNEKVQFDTNSMADANDLSYYPNGNQVASFAQPDKAGQSDQYNIPLQYNVPELTTQEQTPLPGHYPYGQTSDAVQDSYSYDHMSQTVASSYEETSLPSTNMEFYEGESFEHLLRKEPSGPTNEQSATSTSNKSFDYYAQSNFRVRLA